jgi:hypothetical protein
LKASGLSALKKPEDTLQQPDNYEDDCDNERNVDQPTQGAEKNESQQPQYEDNDADSQQDTHKLPPLFPILSITVDLLRILA